MLKRGKAVAGWPRRPALLIFGRNDYLSRIMLMEVVMRMARIWTLALAALLAAGGAGAARAQSETPRQIQAQIAGGDVQGALGALQNAVRVHPDSGVAWYLMAEAQDAAGNEAAARGAFSKAEQLAPGLPFANQADVAALRAHVEAHAGGGISAMVLVIGGLVVLFVLFRLLFRGRLVAPMGYGPAYDGRPQYPAGYGPGYAPGPGGGMGSSLLTGLAAGAGLAAGERIVDDMMGGNNQVPDQGQGFGQDFSQDSGRDDGLQGDPGWDDSSGGGGFDPGGNW